MIRPSPSEVVQKAGLEGLSTQTHREVRCGRSLCSDCFGALRTVPVVSLSGGFQLWKS